MQYSPNLKEPVMKTIRKKHNTVYEIKKSRFIGYLYPLNGADDIEHCLNGLKKQYNDATHIVYAYRTAEGHYRFSDANEPKNSAGRPIFNVIEKNDLYNVLIAVIRYFGGIKLGIGGLVRAYTHTASELIRQGSMRTMEEGYIADILVSYANHDELLRLLSSMDGVSVMKEEFIEHVRIRIAVKRELYKSIASLPAIDNDVIIAKTYLAF